MNTHKSTIEIWSDFRCPFCYIADVMLHNLQREIKDTMQIEFIRHAYELYPDALRHTDSTILDSYARRYGMTRSEAEKKVDAISNYGRRVGISNFNYGGAVPTNTFDAHRLAKYAAEQGIDGIYEKLMYAYFCDNLNIGDRDVLLGIASEMGLHPAKTELMLRNNKYAQVVRDDERQAMQLEIRSIPCFIVDGNQFVGAGSLSALKSFLQSTRLPASA